MEQQKLYRGRPPQRNHDSNMGFYEDDLAWVHDQGFGDFARNAAVVLVGELARRRSSGGTVFDLGCGTGILVRALIDAGYAVGGVDLSEGMLRLAGRRAPEADLRSGSVFEAEIPRCIAVTAIGEILNYSADPKNDPSRRSALVRRVYRALTPGGCFLFDLAGPGRGDSRPQGFREGPDWAVAWDKRVDPKEGLLTRRHTVFRKEGDLWQRSEETHTQQLIAPEVMLGLLAECGFQTEVLTHYDALELPGGLTGFMARKPAKVQRV